MNSRTFAALGLSCAILAGCGGGGGTTSIEPPPGTTFPLQTAVVQYFSTGYQKTATISGTAVYGGISFPVSGTATLSMTPATTASAPFAGQTALTNTTSVSGSVSVNGQTLSVASSSQGYMTTLFEPLGYTTSTDYCVAPTPGTYPSQVTLGQTGTIVIYNCYSDSSMSLPTGTETMSYAVKSANSTTSVIVSIIDSFVDTANQQTISGSTNYLVDTSGAASLLSSSASETVSGVLVNLTFTVQ